MPIEFLSKVRRGLRKPPKVIIKRIGQEITNYAERFLAPKRAQLSLPLLLKKTKHQQLNQLWEYLSERTYCSVTHFIDGSVFEKICPGETETILERAKNALEHRVVLLGSGLIYLGSTINWHKDYKSHHDWPNIFMGDIDYNNPDRPSDVKFPWELSRLQWLIPVGQAYLLTKDETYALSVKNILIDWINNNPYSFGVNWACTMEVALRILTWTWFFHVFKASNAWQDADFQQKFLTSLYLHADFTERHLEFSDINGNHYTADAAGLVFAGLFFGTGDAPERWLDKGWNILCSELPRQVYKDGVDFEGSIPYHRLVLELFFLPARYRELHNLATPAEYRDRLSLMAQFSAAYTQPGGGVPLVGDADDARALPFGNQEINDHRYLCAYVGLGWKVIGLIEQAKGPLSEVFWLYGPSAESLHIYPNNLKPKSCEFPEGGFYIMRNAVDHIFIDCGPLGLAGRGGHGHNDCLGFEAVLDGVKIISDCGAYVYTASYQDRNLFRSTRYHNTPCIDDEEMNRFIRWDYLWNMHYDAKPSVKIWQTGEEYDYFRGLHSGYQRLIDPVTPIRTVQLEHHTHRLFIQDEIKCNSVHEVSIPLHFAPDVDVSLRSDNAIRLKAQGRKFMLYWDGTVEWEVNLEAARISPSYGVVLPSQKLLWRARIRGNAALKICIQPEELEFQNNDMSSVFEVDTNLLN